MADYIFKDAGFEITSINFSPKVAVFGEDITATISIKNVTGVAITNMWAGISMEYPYLSSGGYILHAGSTQFAFVGEMHTPIKYSWGKNVTKTFTFTFPNGYGSKQPLYGKRTVNYVALHIHSDDFLDAVGTNSAYFDDICGVNNEFLSIINKRYSPIIDADFYRANIIDELYAGKSDEGLSIAMDVKTSTYETYDKYFAESEFAELYYSESETIDVNSTEPYYVFSPDELIALRSGLVNNVSILRDVIADLGNDYYFTIVYGDKYETSVVDNFSVSQAFANVHLSGSSTGGVAFGKFSSATEGNPLFECQYPAIFNAPINAYGGIEGVTNYVEGVEELTGGRWIDGKPIYRCVFTGNATTASAGVVVGEIPNLETLIDIYGSLHRSSGAICPVNYWNASNNQCNTLIDNSGTGVLVRSSHAGSVVVVVVYTKSTD